MPDMNTCVLFNMADKVLFTCSGLRFLKCLPRQAQGAHTSGESGLFEGNVKKCMYSSI